MAGVNKNQKKAATAVAGAAGSLQVVGDARRIIPLNKGRHAYVLVGGKSRHVATDSPAFDALMVELAGTGAGGKTVAELRKYAAAHPTHGWSAVADRVDALLATGAAS